jgi:hypothetical protein
MADAYATAAFALETIIKTEFMAEGFTVVHDRLHNSLGWKGTIIGLSPEVWRPNARNRLVRETRILVQFYDKYEKELIDPAEHVDPRRITGFAERFEQAVQRQQASVAGTPEVWYFDVDEVAFPNDPHDNKTRFHAVVLVRGQNSGITPP